MHGITAPLVRNLSDVPLAGQLSFWASFLSCFVFLCVSSSFFFLIFSFFSTFISGIDRDRAWTGEGQRERGTQNRKQAPGSEPSAQSPTRGSNPRTARSWPGWSQTLNRLRHPGAPSVRSSSVGVVSFHSFFGWQFQCWPVFTRAFPLGFHSKCTGRTWASHYKQGRLGVLCTS